VGWGFLGGSNKNQPHGFEEVESREWEIGFLTPYLHFFSFQLEARGKKFSSFVCVRGS
jgi:hypothetical protein